MDGKILNTQRYTLYIAHNIAENKEKIVGQSMWSVTDQRSEDNMEILRSLLERPLDSR